MKSVLAAGRVAVTNDARIEFAYARGWELIARLVREEGQVFSGRERNCCFINTVEHGLPKLRPSPDLTKLMTARASAVVDWDQDGDLDIWVSNRTSPRIRFLKNEGGSSANFVSLHLVGVEW